MSMVKRGIGGTGLVLLSVGIWFIASQNVLQPAQRSRPKPYNVILISIDTLRADHIGTYGYARDTSPNLDTFIDGAVLFEQAVAQGTISLASYASLFTSQYPSVNGARTKDQVLTQPSVTLAEVLRDQGYNTAAFVGQFQLAAPHGFPQGFDVYENLKDNTFASTIPAAVEWLTENKDEKFFLFLQGYDLHAPYHAPEPFQHVFDSDYNGILSDHKKFSFSSDTQDSNSILQFLRKKQGTPVLDFPDKAIPLDQRDIDHIAAHYDSELFYVDSLLKGFLDFLRESHLYENSIIVLLSDHGESLGDNLYRSSLEGGGLFGHGQMYEEIVHVLLAMQAPEIAPKRIDIQAQLIDIFPTVLDLLNIPVGKDLEKRLQGRSLVLAMKDKIGEHFNEYAYGEGAQFNQSEFVRTLQWKLISNGDERFELYNLVDDPKETQNVADQHSEVVEKYKAKLLEWELKNLKKKLQIE